MRTENLVDVQGIRRRMNNKEGAHALTRAQALASRAGFEVKSGSRPPPIGFNS